MTLIHTYWAHLLLQLRVGWRDPTYFFMTIFLPTGIYWFFAVPESVTPYIASYLICSFSAFAFVGVFFFQNAIAFAQAKQQPWQRFVGGLPSAEGAQFAARFLTSSFFGALAALSIYATGRAATEADLTLWQMSQVIGRLSLGGLPFLLFAQWCGRICSPRAITPIANFLYLSLSFAGGLWKPWNMLPPLVAKVTVYLPTYHYGRLVWEFATADEPLTWHSLAYLALFAFVIGILRQKRSPVANPILGS